MSELALAKKELPPVEDKKENRSRKIKRVLEVVLTTLLVLTIIVASINIFVSQYYTRVNIDGRSMSPTLNNFNNGAVKYQEYGLMDTSKRQINSLKRNDIIVFSPTLNEDAPANEFYIKRLIGLPNETVYIYKDIEEVVVQITKQDGSVEKLKQKYLTQGAKPATYTKDSDAVYAIDKPLTLGENQYYVMGDNRLNSIDSRFSKLGPISTPQILGKLVVIQGYDTFNNEGKKTNSKDYMLWDWRYY